MAASKRCLALSPWIALTTILVSLLCNGMIVSIQANISDEVWVGNGKLGNIPVTYYGVLFGIFKLTVFLSSTLFGKYLSSFGVRKVFIGGLIMTGTMAITFGLLNQTKLREEILIALLVAVRIIGAVGTTAFLTASYTIVADLFCDSLGTMFAFVQMFLAIGILIGHFLTTFFGTFVTIQLLGCILVFLATVSSMTLPSFKKSPNLEGYKDFGIIRALKIHNVTVAALSVFAASIAIGTLHTTPERHLLGKFHLTTPQIGFFFVMYTGACALVTPFWGLLSDTINPKYAILLGSFLTSLGFTLLGPLPLTGLTASHSLSLVSVVFAGAGIGAQLVAAFTEAQRSALDNGFPADISTYFLVSSIWTAAFALGAFMGPVTAGVLFDNVGFAWSTLFVVGWNVLVYVCTVQCLPLLLQTVPGRYSFRNKEKRTDSNEIMKCLIEKGENKLDYQAIKKLYV